MSGPTPPIDMDAVRQARQLVREQYPDDRPAPSHDEALAERVGSIRMEREARRLADLADAPVLEWWGVDEVLSSPSPEPLVPGFLYRDSLARVFGPPGGAKSFLMLDLALHVATGRPWCGREITAAPVVYAAAEGQRVTHDRLRAWMTHHRIGPEALRGRLVLVPHAVRLSEAGVAAFCDRAAELGPGLVILDTKNAMMIGDENSAADVAEMRRALDRIRTVSGACVALVDHTGHSVTERARGSSAVTAAMDSEVSVALEAPDGGRAATVTATVTRDKAAESGTEQSLTLASVGPAAVLVPRGADGARRPVDPGWRTHPIPRGLAEAAGRGSTHVPTLARFMAADALGDTDGVGLSRAEALRGIGLGHDNAAARQAWSQLLAGDWIAPCTGVKSPTGRHRWAVDPPAGTTPLRADG